MIIFEDNDYCFKLLFREFEVEFSKVCKDWYLYDISLFDKNKQEYVYSTFKENYKFFDGDNGYIYFHESDLYWLGKFFEGYLILNGKIKNTLDKKFLDGVKTALKQTVHDDPYKVMSVEMEMGCYVESKDDLNIVHFILFVQREEKFKFSMRFDDEKLLKLARELQKQLH